MSEEMQEGEAPISLREVVGAMVFAARDPLGVREIRTLIAEVAEESGDPLFEGVKDKEVRAVLDELEATVAQAGLGLRLVEFADGYAFQTDADCSPWLRKLLKVEPRRRLSRPALETLAIIAYRQPVVRSEIEGVRGVSVDHIIRTLLELQLIRIVGRSELPGRPLMYGTTQHFLDHFGLKQIVDLPGIDQLSRAEADRIRAEENAQRNQNQSTEEEGIETDASGDDEDEYEDEDDSGTPAVTEESEESAGEKG